MDHAFYVFSSWGISLLALAGITLYVLFDSRRLQNELKRLEAQGIRRRSAEPAASDEASR